MDIAVGYICPHCEEYAALRDHRCDPHVIAERTAPIPIDDPRPEPEVMHGNFGSLRIDTSKRDRYDYQVAVNSARSFGGLGR